MSTPVITIFVRHTPTCKYVGDEFAKACRCRKHLRWSQSGKQFRKQAGTRSWAEAELVKADLTDQLSGRVTEKRVPEVTTIRAAYDSFIREKTVQQISSDALRKYTLELMRFVSFAESRSIFAVEAITRGLLTDYKAGWPELYPSSYTRKYVQVRLRVFLRFAHESGWLKDIPKMATVDVDEPPTLPLSGEEYTRLLAVVSETFWKHKKVATRVRAIIQLMRWSGLAVRDASCLRSGELLLSSNKIYRVLTARQKTGVHVYVPIPTDVAEEILTAAQKDSEHFFLPSTFTPLSFAAKTSQQISAAFDKAGIESEGHMVSHRLRDTFAVDLLSKGVPMEELSKLLGHESVTTTEKHYAQWAKGRQDRVDALVTGTWAVSSLPA